MEDIKLVSEKIYEEVKTTYLTICLKDIETYLITKKDNDEIFLKIKRSPSFKLYLKEKKKEKFQTLEKIDKSSHIFKFEKSKYEVTKEGKCFLLDRTRRYQEVYFNKDSDCVGTIFGDYNHRLSEEFLKSSNLNQKEFLFINDGRGKNIINNFLKTL